ncbi:hypothetical protein RCH23_002275 [Cryobacterium sp. CAN_C3]|uniref:hypothetical protein n=1 Tax=unclassified Cryobacterium TaxID=2649013 RepID=UPI0018C9A4F5|nr:hypothetical protein [Cryobacterium sp. CAN_C3]MEC5154887.1 hypothetical protein [Cryobacterium sp. CAN_C3]
MDCEDGCGGPAVLYLYADASRLTPAVDPLSRQTTVSQGTFLEYLRVAALKLGYSSTFDLFPDGTYDESALVKFLRQFDVFFFYAAASWRRSR